MKRLALLVLVLPWLAACGIYRPLQIEPQRKATTPIAPGFSQSYYYYDRDRNVYFVMRSQANDAGGKPVEQIAIIRMFWQPHGGVTTLNSTALNATFRYIVLTADAIGLYEGAGFVRPSSKPGASRYSARVVDGDLRLTQASARFVDTLGRAHLHGSFTATYDDAKAVDMMLDSEQKFFARSLRSLPAETAPAPSATSTGPATAPATTPATTPATENAPATAPGTMP